MQDDLQNQIWTPKRERWLKRLVTFSLPNTSRVYKNGVEKRKFPSAADSKLMPEARGEWPTGSRLKKKQKKTLVTTDVWRSYQPRTQHYYTHDGRCTRFFFFGFFLNQKHWLHTTASIVAEYLQPQNSELESSHSPSRTQKDANKTKCSILHSTTFK